MKKINFNLKDKIRCGFLPMLLGASTTAKWGTAIAVATGISLLSSLTSSILNISTNISEPYSSYNYTDELIYNINKPKPPSYIANTILPSIRIF